MFYNLEEQLNNLNEKDIELIIKIPEKTYKHIMSMQFYIPGSRGGKSLLEEILRAIRTGTPRICSVDLVSGEPKESDVPCGDCDNCEHLDGDCCRLIYEEKSKGV